jgi:hypothetical protein
MMGLRSAIVLEILPVVGLGNLLDHGAVIQVEESIETRL